MTARQWGLLSVLALLWGVAFLFSKITLGELRPFTCSWAWRGWRC